MTDARASPLSRLRARPFREVDIAWLAAFRVAFGTVMCVSMLRFLAYGWIDELFVKPAYHFKYAGFGWVEPLSRGGMHALFWALAALALAVALGFCFRPACALFVIGFTYVQLIDVATYLNHYYLAVLLAALLAVSPAHRAFSLDALWRKGVRRDRVVGIWYDLFRLQVGVVYTFAGLAKANADWLAHAQPLRIWLGGKTGMPMLGPLFALQGSAVFMSWAGFLFDSTVVWFLLARRTRPFAYAAVIVFHVLTRVLFPIGMFPAIMIVAALVFFSPSWPRRVLALAGQGAWLGPAPVVSPASSSPPSWPRRLAVATALAYCAFQVAFPLRFLAYGGDVRWHEQGMRFSWRVMVREKNGSITYVVRSKTTGRTWYVSPRSMLTRLQERELSTQPDLVLRLAHHVRDDFEARGLGPVEVHVDALVSLNGRRVAPLIDPSVDLAATEESVRDATWILPVPVAPPPHLRPI